MKFFSNHGNSCTPGPKLDTSALLAPDPERARQMEADVARMRERSKRHKGGHPKGVIKDGLPPNWAAYQAAIEPITLGRMSQERTIIYAVVARAHGLSLAAVGRALGGLTVQQIMNASKQAESQKNKHLNGPISAALDACAKLKNGPTND